jgi:hypothetical protein
MVRVWLALFVWMILVKSWHSSSFSLRILFGKQYYNGPKGGLATFNVLSKPTRIHFNGSEPLLLRLSFYGRGRHNIILTLKDPRAAYITFAIKERFRTLIGANAIQFNVLTLEYYSTFGTLMIAQTMPPSRVTSIID